MTAAPVGHRTALLDSSLVARSAARRFLGVLAELGGVVMVSTADTEAELPRAIGNVLESRTSDIPLNERHAREMAELQAWRREYLKAGLWQHEPPPPPGRQVLHEEALRVEIGTLWERYRTDPDDLHLARDAVRFGVDAVLTTNMSLVGAPDWTKIMLRVTPQHPPELCQEEMIIDWTLGVPEISGDPETMTRYMLSALPFTGPVEARVKGWARYLRAPFPKMGAAMDGFLRQIPDQALRALHELALAEHPAPVSQRAMSTPRP